MRKEPFKNSPNVFYERPTKSARMCPVPVLIYIRV